MSPGFKNVLAMRSSASCAPVVIMTFSGLARTPMSVSYTHLLALGVLDGLLALGGHVVHDLLALGRGVLIHLLRLVRRLRAQLLGLAPRDVYKRQPYSIAVARQRCLNR